MTQINTFNAKLSNLQLNKLKSGIKNGIQVTINFSSCAVGDADDKTKFPLKILLTNTGVSQICKAFANGS